MIGFDHVFLIDIDENESDGASDSYTLGSALGPDVARLVSVECPTDVKGLDKIKPQVSSDGSTWKNLYDGGNLVVYAVAANYVIVIPEDVAMALCIWPFVRVVGVDGSNAAEEPTGDVEFNARFVLQGVS